MDEEREVNELQNGDADASVDEPEGGQTAPDEVDEGEILESDLGGVSSVLDGDAQAELSGKKKKPVNIKKEILEWVRVIAIAVAAALVLRNFVFTMVKVSGASMEPTLQNDDQLFVNRFFYQPHKGDIVIFTPDLPSEAGRPFVKRVIATAGDTVYIDLQAHKVILNGEPLDEPYINGVMAQHSQTWLDRLESRGEYGPSKPLVIEEGYVWVMGDNRNNSRDSRELGPIKVGTIMGGVGFRLWPLNKFGGV